MTQKKECECAHAKAIHHGRGGNIFHRGMPKPGVPGKCNFPQCLCTCYTPARPTDRDTTEQRTP